MGQMEEMKWYWSGNVTCHYCMSKRFFVENIPVYADARFICDECLEKKRKEPRLYKVVLTEDELKAIQYWFSICAAESEHLDKVDDSALEKIQNALYNKEGLMNDWR